MNVAFCLTLQSEESVMPDPDRIIRIRTVLDRTGLSRSTLYRKIGEGTFPRQLKLGQHSAGWRESAVNEWVRNPMFYSVDDHPGA